MGQLRPVRSSPSAPTYAHAVEAFLAAHAAGTWSPATAVKYRQTLTGLGTRLAGTPVARDVAVLDTELGAASLLEAFTAAYAGLAPATRVRHLSTLRSALSWWREAAGWLTTDPTSAWAGPKVAVDTTRALTRGQVTALLRLEVELREKALWRLLYESAARAQEILGLDVADLDLASKRGRVVSKGGKTEWVFWQSGTAQLLPRLLAGRARGPLFLTDRRAVRALPGADLCPDTGRARLSYRRAAELFAEHTRALADPVEQAEGWTLHQLRHSALTHAAEDGTNTPMLLARSRHASIRSLERYARPGPEAVAAHLAATDPAARRPARRP